MTYLNYGLFVASILAYNPSLFHKITTYAQNMLKTISLLLINQYDTSIKDKTLPSIPLTTRDEAARKITKFMQSFQARLQGLYKDIAYMQDHLKEPEVETLIPLFLKKQHPLIDFYPKALQKVELFFQELKKLSQEKTYILSKGKIPAIKIVLKASNLAPTLQFIPLEQGDFAENCSTGQRPVKNKEEVDYLVRVLSKIKEIPWSYKFSGCEFKSTLAYQILESMGVQKNTIKKIWATGENSFLSWSSEKIPKEFRYWRWHVALILTTENQEKYVIDPSSDSTQALSLEDWKKHLGSDISIKTEEISLSCLMRGQDIAKYSQTDTIQALSHFNCEELVSQKSERECKEIALSLLNKKGFSQMYFYRYLAALPFESKIRKILSLLFTTPTIQCP